MLTGFQFLSNQPTFPDASGRGPFNNAAAGFLTNWMSRNPQHQSTRGKQRNTDTVKENISRITANST